MKFIGFFPLFQTRSSEINLIKNMLVKAGFIYAATARTVQEVKQILGDHPDIKVIALHGFNSGGWSQIDKLHLTMLISSHHLKWVHTGPDDGCDMQTLIAIKEELAWEEAGQL